MTEWDPDVKRWRDPEGRFSRGRRYGDDDFFRSGLRLGEGGFVGGRRLFGLDEREGRSVRSRPTAAQRRARLNSIKDTADLSRGARPPRDRSEQMDLEWASPRKIAEQRALTGDIRMPRLEAIRRNVGMLRRGTFGGFGQGTSRDFPSRDPRTDVVRQPFTGKWTVVRGRLRSYFDDKGQMQIEKRVRRQPFRRAAARRAGY